MNNYFKNVKKHKQTEKARLCAMGENSVIVKLMQKEWDAFNANSSIINFKSIDIVCIDSSIPESEEKWWKPRTSLIQVKTSVEKNITTGFTLEEALNKDYLKENVKGPYVFVYASKENNTYSFRYFIVPRSLFVELLYSSNYYYVKVKHKNDNLKLSAPAGVYLSWLEGKPEFSSKDKTSFGNPVTENCADRWDNIWKE